MTTRPSYVYRYDHIDSFGKGLFDKLGLPQCETRACHMAEVPLVFGNTALNFTFSPREHSIISAVQTSIASSPRAAM